MNEEGEKTKCRESREIETAEKFISKQDDLNYSTFLGTWKVWMAWKKKKVKINREGSEGKLCDVSPPNTHTQTRTCAEAWCHTGRDTEPAPQGLCAPEDILSGREESLEDCWWTLSRTLSDSSPCPQASRPSDTNTTPAPSCARNTVFSLRY